MPELTRWWPLPELDDLRRRLEAAYAAPGRGYHDMRHLAEVLQRLDELSVAHSFDRDTVRLAAWFHDAVYDGRPRAEARSAEWAAEALAATAVDLPEVVRLVRLTELHSPSADDHNGAALCDADLAILAADPGRYAEYVAGVRQEYAHVRDRDFALGRISVLEGLLEKTSLFTTPHARQQWEEQGRANVSRELVSLRAQAWGAADPPAADA